jgi:hypothetical protein
MSLLHSELDERRYEGFVSFTYFRNGGLSPGPPDRGSYAVLVEGIKPEFIEVSRGGHFKGKDPSVEISALREKWIHGASVVYIGKAENMQRRLRKFCLFGAGAAIVTGVVATCGRSPGATTGSSAGRPSVAREPRKQVAPVACAAGVHDVVGVPVARRHVARQRLAGAVALVGHDDDGFHAEVLAHHSTRSEDGAGPEEHPGAVLGVVGSSDVQSARSARSSRSGGCEPRSPSLPRSYRGGFVVYQTERSRSKESRIRLSPNSNSAA